GWNTGASAMMPKSPGAVPNLGGRGSGRALPESDAAQQELRPAPEAPALPASAPTGLRRAQQDHWLVRWSVILGALASVGVLVVLPVVYVFYYALADGFGVYWQNLFGDADTRHAIFLTLIVAPTAVVLNVIFGIAAAWAIARFKFPGRTLLTS